MKIIPIVRKLKANNFKSNDYEIISNVDDLGNVVHQIFLDEAESIFVKEYLDFEYFDGENFILTYNTHLCEFTYDIEHEIYNHLVSDIRFKNTPPIYMLQNDYITIKSDILYCRSLKDQLIKQGIDQKQLCRIGAFLGSFHLYFNKDTFIKYYEGLNKHVPKLIVEEQYLATAKLFDNEPELQKKIRALSEDILNPEYKTLVHGDLKSSNFYGCFADKSVCNLFNYENAHIGTPIHDIAVVLAELYISACYHQQNILYIFSFALNHKLSTENSWDIMENRYIVHKHIGVQMLYRLLGDKKEEHTGFIEEPILKEQLVVLAKQFVTRDYENEKAHLDMLKERENGYDATEECDDEDLEGFYDDFIY